MSLNKKQAQIEKTLKQLKKEQDRPKEDQPKKPIKRNFNSNPQ